MSNTPIDNLNPSEADYLALPSELLRSIMYGVLRGAWSVHKAEAELTRRVKLGELSPIYVSGPIRE